MPVFQQGQEQLVFIAHLLTRVMRCARSPHLGLFAYLAVPSCACRQKLHIGLFRCNKYKGYRRQVPTKVCALPAAPSLC